MRDVPLILIVDDMPQNLDLLTRRLRSQGYDVATAADGEEALDRGWQSLRPTWSCWTS